MFKKLFGLVHTAHDAEGFTSTQYVDDNGRSHWVLMVSDSMTDDRRAAVMMAQDEYRRRIVKPE